MRHKIRSGSKVGLFLKLAEPDENGFSRRVSVEEFTGEFHCLKFGNGGDWCRSDGTLAKNFLFERFKKKGAIVAIQLFGYNEKNKISKQIRKDIVNIISTQKCSILNISNVEVDHKDGRRDDYQNFIIENQKVEQFQPLSPSVNKAKRQHCKICRETGMRFDARILGFSASCWTGDGIYRGSCVGCYWHDIKKYNKEISKDYKMGIIPKGENKPGTPYRQDTNL